MLANTPPLGAHPFPYQWQCLGQDLSLAFFLFLRVCHFHFISPLKRMEVSFGSNIVLPAMRAVGKGPGGQCLGPSEAVRAP